MSDNKNRSLSLPRTDLEDFRRYADELGMSLSAWLVAAGRRERARQSAQAYAQFVADPEVAAELAAWEATTAPHRAAEWARLHADDRAAAMGEAA
jgi:hypothetical protein